MCKTAEVTFVIFFILNVSGKAEVTQLHRIRGGNKHISYSYVSVNQMTNNNNNENLRLMHGFHNVLVFGLSLLL